MMKIISGERPNHRCAYRDCSNGPLQNGKKLFRFPKQFDRLHVWLANCGNERLHDLAFETIIKYGICADHFPDSAFRNADKFSINRDSVPLPYGLPQLKATSDQSRNVGVTTSSFIDQDIAVDEVAIPVKRMRCDTDENDLSLRSNSDNITAAHERIPTLSHSIPQTHETQYDKLSAKIEKLKRENTYLRRELKICNKMLSRCRSRNNKYKMNQHVGKPCRTSAKQKFASGKKTVMSLVNKMTLAPAAKAMISLQLHTNKAPYSDEEINLAKQFHYYSPAALRRLRKAGCNFPSLATLKRWVMDHNIQPGFTESIFDALKEKLMKLNPEERYCCLKFDETVIKSYEEYSPSLDCIEGLVDLGPLGRTDKRAKSILVFCVDSINANHPWRQPIAYVLSETTLHADKLLILLKMCLSKLKNAGANVKMVTCDQGPANQSVFKKLKVNSCNPHFEHEGSTYIACFDFPHLIKRLAAYLRDEKQLMKIFRENEVIAAWQDYLDTWTVDRTTTGGSNLLSHITEKHMKPKPWEAMNVKRAFQLFSNRFSCAIRTAGETNELKSHTWRESAEFAERLNSVIDACNCYSTKATVGAKRTLSTKNPEIEQILIDFLDWSCKWSKKPNYIQKLPCMEGLQLTVRALILVYKSISEEYPDFELATALCNQDSVEHLFSKLRQRGGFNANPTARMNRISLRHIISSGYIYTSDRGNVNCPAASNLINSPKSDCSKQIIEDFNNDESPITNDDELDELDDDLISDALEQVDMHILSDQDVSSTASPQSKTYDQNAVTYLSGFDAFRTLQKYNCDCCREDMCKTPMDEVTPNEIYLSNREYKNADEDAPAVTKLTRPRDEFIRIVEIQLRRFHDKCNELWSSQKILEKLMHECISETNKRVPTWFDPKHECYTHRLYALKYLVLVRLYAITRHHNQAALRDAGKNKMSQKMRNLTNQ